MIEHQDQYDGIFVWKESLDNSFVEDSVFYGYDYVKRTPQEKLPQSEREAGDMFYGICMSLSES